MPIKEEELQTLMEDVKTIKSILKGTDAPPPRVWKMVYPAAVLVAILGFVQYLVPLLRTWNFLERFLYLWFPVGLVFGCSVLIFLQHELKKQGRGFLTQSRVQNLLFVRLIVPPAILILAFVYSMSNQPFSFEGFCLVLLSTWVTAMVPLLPKVFRLVPATFLVTGFLEILFNFKGDLIGLGNTLLVSLALIFGATLFRLADKEKREQEPPSV